MRVIRIPSLFPVASAAILVGAACGDGGTQPDPPPPENRAPAAAGSVAPQTIPVGESASVDVASNFSDPDGDALAYSVATSDAAVATASVSGSNVTVEGVSAGTATVTATARDPAGLTAAQNIAVTVEAVNRAPVAEDIQDLIMEENQGVAMNAAAFFSDPDGDELAFAATSSDDAVATVEASDADLFVTAVAPGSATVTVTATDPGGLSASQRFDVIVAGANRMPEIAEPIPAQTLVVGDTAALDASRHFGDPDGDELAFAAASSDAAVAAVSVSEAVVAVVATGAGSATVTVTATDPGELSASQRFDVTVAGAAPEIVHAIPAHDMIVDSMVALDVSPYFEGDELTYAAATSDRTVAAAAAEGGTVTTTGVGAAEDGVSVALLSVTATARGGASVTQDSILVRVHREEYDTLPGISVREDGSLAAQLPGGGGELTLGLCLQLKNFPVGGRPFTVFWSEWQRRAGGGWIVAQDNAEAHMNARPDAGGSICPIKIGEDRFPPGVYRLVGHVQIGEEVGHYRTSSFEKRP